MDEKWTQIEKKRKEDLRKAKKQWRFCVKAEK